MRLKKIELKGFKSFGNSTVLHFNEDVVGVVGPNGSGKSNIVDAFRWVLGEQKTTGLRLEKMADVLFNGTKTRKPANACSVTLVFDNNRGVLPSEYNEVAISRHLYRSGNSEYRLNGVSCRLKDITSLLSDTGIASNSYAIIALDMVDDILSDKDHARRRMFEQAAGISKFKQRKKEVQNKLAASEADLERVQDLLFEISANLNELEKQAKKARSYKKVKEKYRDLSILLARLKIHDHVKANEKLADDLRRRSEDFSGIRAEMAKLEAEIQKSKKDSLLEEEKLNASQKALAEIINSLNKLEGRQQLNRQSVKNIREGVARRKNRLEELHLEDEKVQSRIEYLREQIKSESKSLNSLEDKLKQLEEQKLISIQEVDKLKTRHEGLSKVMEANESEFRELEQSILIRNNKLEASEAEMNRLRIEEKIEQDKDARLQNELQTVDKEISGLEVEKGELQHKEEERKKTLALEKTKRESLSEKQNSAERKLDSLSNEHRLLKSMLEKMEGYPESIKHLSNQKEWRKNAALLSELIYCPEEYRSAVEGILEPWLDNYVVPSWQAAQEGIAILRTGQKGKARFLLLDGFENDDRDVSQGPYEGWVTALSVIQVDDNYKALFTHLLKGVYISSTDQMPEEFPIGADVIVSADGQTVRRKTSAEGGSADLFSGKKIGRKKALDLLEEKIKKLKAEVEKNKAELQKISAGISQLDTDQLMRSVNILEKKISEATSRKAGILATRSSGEDVVRKRRERMGEIEQERTELSIEIERLTAEKSSVEKSLSTARDTVEKSRGELESALESKGARAEEYNRQNIELIRQQNKLSGFEKELSFQQGRAKDIQNEIAGLQTESKEAENQLLQLDEEYSDVKMRLESLYTDKKSAESALNQKEQQYFSSRNAIFEREKELSQLSANASDLQSVTEQLKEKNREVEFNIRAIRERILVEFNSELPVEISDLTEEELQEDRSELLQKTDRLKTRLGNFGDVNPLALEAFDEMKVRYDDIIEQKEDIENARDSLRETILEIETTAKERYIEAYERIRFNFINVFRSLFTEDDNCDLVLTDPDNPLESDIEIVAKPKGKRPQSISQLSGGEKTLTAISLLFALYLLKPAPFCIFDEVDAPLDDANIEKFNRIIKRFSNESQFIIVTHNKQTMSHLDIIYGVYMEESGVSGVSAVDFRAIKNADFLTDVQEKEF